MTTPHCVFCHMIETKDPIVTFHGSEISSFEPLLPCADGHRLFVPVRHAGSAAEDAAGAALALQMAATWAGEQGEDFNLITSGGPASTQTILHTHIHYVPRRAGDNLLLPWSEQEATMWARDRIRTLESIVADRDEQVEGLLATIAAREAEIGDQRAELIHLRQQAQELSYVLTDPTARLVSESVGGDLVVLARRAVLASQS